MLIIGHRGARGLAPENTLASLQSALDTHVGMIEIDVRVTKDGTPVLSHDSKLMTSDDNTVRVEESDYSELQLAKPDLLTLEAALQFIDRRTDVVIEIKPGQPVEPIAACIQPRVSLPGHEINFILASFDFKLLSKLHDTFPLIPVAVNEKWSGIRATSRAKRLGTKRITMNHRWLWSGFIKLTARQGYMLSAYTLNNVKRARRFEKCGLYGCITDYPERFLMNYTITND